MQIINDSLQWFHGAFGYPAVTSAVWFLVWTSERVSRGLLLLPGIRSQAILIFCLLGLFLYPMALGLGSWDPYRNGYSPTWLFVIVVSLALWGWWKRNWLVVLLLGSATLAYGLEMKASSNYWDYLLDPFLVIYCLSALLANAWRTVSIRLLVKKAA